MKDRSSEDDFSPKLKSPSKLSEVEEDELEEDEDEVSSSFQRKFLNFRELKGFYTHMCKLQIQELRNKLGKNHIDEFLRTNVPQQTFVDQLSRPENYKKMCELQMEEIKKSELYQKLNHLDRVKRVGDGPKQYLCSKCGQPKRGHVCTATDEEKVRPKRNEDENKVEDDKKSLRKRLRPNFVDTEEPAKISKNEPSKAIQPEMPLKIKNSLKVVVIGAGIAGITAARELKLKGFDVTVLEGRERIGGRVHTITSEELKPGCGIDIGASFIYGAQNNPLTSVCRTLGLRLHPSDSKSYILYDMEGNRINDVLDQQLEKTFNAFIEQTGRIRGKPSHFLKRRVVMRNTPRLDIEGEMQCHIENDKSLGETMNEVLLQWQKNNNPITNEQWSTLNWYFTNIEGAYGSDLSSLSLFHWDQDDALKSSDISSVLIPQGYGHVINSLAQGLDIKLNHKVERINYDKNTIMVETTKGNIEANYVICTLPLGILKEGNVTFSPVLPPEKQLAISKLGFGLVNKLVLFFSNVFWDENEDYIGSTSSSESRGEFYLFINMYKVVGTPVLVALIAGSSAQSIESRPGEDVVSRAMAILQRIYKEKAGNPTRAVVTRWASDPFALGAFSYLRVGSSAEEYDIMAKPVADRIFFAGEATHREHPATVTGAYLSGVRAANEVVQISNGKKYSHPEIETKLPSSVMRHTPVPNQSIPPLSTIPATTQTLQDYSIGQVLPAATLASTQEIASYHQNIPLSFIQTQSQPVSSPYVHSDFSQEIPSVNLAAKIASQAALHTQMATQTFSPQTVSITSHSPVINYSTAPHQSQSNQPLTTFNSPPSGIPNYSSPQTTSTLQSMIYSNTPINRPQVTSSIPTSQVQSSFGSSPLLQATFSQQISSASQQTLASPTQNISQEQIQHNNFNPQNSTNMIQGSLMNTILSHNPEINFPNDVMGNLDDPS